ncbi:MAG: 4Fe-4S binding protein [Dysgonamonadaceae bacterium]|jgi:NAD-dependent dihydropyrimidine dehydrogenase PreA subunit|nr:4Fe-4S binding protein [Dysgonamonadaceae bacterium]
MFWERKSDFIAHVIAGKCQHCRYSTHICKHICKHKALITTLVNGKMTTFVHRPEKCTGCGKCVKTCPERAIELIKRNV